MGGGAWGRPRHWWRRGLFPNYFGQCCLQCCGRATLKWAQCRYQLMAGKSPGTVLHPERPELLPHCSYIIANSRQLKWPGCRRLNETAAKELCDLPDQTAASETVV